MPNFYRYLPCMRYGTVGDSLAGQVAPANWQQYLYQTLNQNSKIQIQFVGNDNGPSPIWTNTYAGQRIDQIDANLTTTVLPQNEPDLVIVMAGTNDALQSASSSTMLTRTATLITNFFTARPGIRLVYAKPPPLSLAGAGVTQAKIDALAAYVASMTSAWASANFPQRLLSIVDCWTGFNVDTMLSDGIHQNELGARFMSNAMLGTGIGPIVDAFGRQADTISV